MKKTHIVDPDDVWVIAPTATPTITLITCYPFSFVGNAPHRFIVQAELVEDLGGSVLTGHGGAVETNNCKRKTVNYDCLARLMLSP